MAADKHKMRQAKAQVEKLLEKSQSTAGMYVRVYGDNLIIGRRESYDLNLPPENSDRVRLTRLGTSSYGLSIKRHTGRWEQAPFSGSIKDMAETIQSVMQHLVAPYI